MFLFAVFADSAIQQSNLLPPDKGQAIHVGRSYSLKSAILSQTRRINVYFPPEYASDQRSYPVVFLLDGGLKEDFLHIAGIASLAAEFRNMRALVLVGIEGIDRYHDSIHPSEVTSDQKRLPTSGGAEAFRLFLEKELLPFVSARFRVTEERMLIGESAAGLFVVETLLRKPHLFRGYIAVSPMLWWDNQSLAKSAGVLLAQRPFPADRQLFLTIANEGGAMREGVDRLVAALKSKAASDLDWQFQPMPRETHGTIFHPAALIALRHFFKMKPGSANP